MNIPDFECEDTFDGIRVCRKKDKSDKQSEEKRDKTIIEEIGSAVVITTAPYLTRDEAAYIETSFAVTLFGYLISAISIAFGFYIYFIIGSFAFVLIPDPFWNSMIVMVILLGVIIVLGFVQYRFTKALVSTKILERIAVDAPNQDTI